MWEPHPGWLGYYPTGCDKYYKPVAKPHSQNAQVKVKVGTDSHTIMPSNPFEELFLVLATFKPGGLVGTTIQGVMLPASTAMVLMICKPRWFSRFFGLFILRNQQEKKGSLCLQARLTQFP